jgi:hypothetical protein
MAAAGRIRHGEWGGAEWKKPWMTTAQLWPRTS